MVLNFLDLNISVFSISLLVFSEFRDSPYNGY
jgi:hypothetical protein